jgi:hexosaminidase
VSIYLNFNLDSVSWVSFLFFFYFVGKIEMGLKSAWLVVVFLFLGAAVAKNVNELNVWPMPKWVSRGHSRVYMSQDFQLVTDGSKYIDGSEILKDGFTRMLDVVKVAHVVDGDLSRVDKSLIIKGIHVLIFSPDDQVWCHWLSIIFPVRTFSFLF